jgi:oxepin-CoA hydrolase/3-oxo-5,6-dehydrosuberyl-CoA semialdehyde dehydrogenase
MMTAQHLVEHLEFFNRMALGEVETDITTPEEHIEKYQESLWNYKAMPKEFKHPLLKKDEAESLRFENLEEAKKAYLESYDRFIEFFEANPTAKTANTVFGMLDKYHWYLLNRKHLNHHFSQFGLI